MSDSNDLFSGCAGLVAILAVVAIVIVVVYLLVQVLVAGGAVYGAAIALRNYGLAFARNVKPQRVPA